VLLPEQDAAVADKLRRQGANLCRTMVEVARPSRCAEARAGTIARPPVQVEHVTGQAGG
jgi:hypothetical protein